MCQSSTPEMLHKNIHNQSAPHVQWRPAVRGHNVAIYSVNIEFWNLSSRSQYIPITWSTLFTSIRSNWFLFHTYCEFGCLQTHSRIRSLPSSLLPFLSGYSGSVWFRCMRFLRPPAKMTSIPLPCGYSASCKAESTLKVVYVHSTFIILQIFW